MAVGLVQIHVGDLRLLVDVFEMSGVRGVLDHMLRLERDARPNVNDAVRDERIEVGIAELREAARLPLWRLAVGVEPREHETVDLSCLPHTHARRAVGMVAVRNLEILTIGAPQPTVERTAETLP